MSGDTDGERPQRLNAHEAAPATANDRLQRVFGSRLAGILFTDLHGAIYEVNDRFLEIVGYDRADFEQGLVRWDELTPPEHRDTDARAIAEFLATGGVRTYEKEFARKDGTRAPVMIGVEPLEGEGSDAKVVFVVIELTRRNRAERARQESEQRLQLAQEGAGIGTWDWDITSRGPRWSAEQYKLFGVEPKPPDFELDYAEFWHRIHADDRERIKAATAAALADERPYETEFRVIRPDGVRWLMGRAKVIRDPSGRPVRMLGINMDVTERRQAEDALRDLASTLEQRVEKEVAERQAAQAALLQAQKLESLGQLTGGIAHDFNNLLTVILGNLDIMQRRTGDERLIRMIHAATHAAERGAKLTEQLLAYARRQHLTPRAMDLGDIVTRMSEMVRRTLGGTITVDTALAEDGWHALVDPTQLELVLLNLAINARDAMPDGGSMRIETRNMPVSAGPLPRDLVAGDYVLLTVTDTGCGMSELVRAKAFEPFFTTKEIGKGSGLGLSQVYGFALQSGGTAQILSELGRGTTVQIWLPRAVAEHPPEVPAKPPEAAASAATILVVDDDDEVRDVTVAQLETLGYRTLEASSGRAALELLQSGQAADLLMVDYAMPELSGIDVARAAAAWRPDLPVLFITGHACAPEMKDFASSTLLKKPYRQHELGFAVAQALLPDRSPIESSD